MQNFQAWFSSLDCSICEKYVLLLLQQIGQDNKAAISFKQLSRLSGYEFRYARKVLKTLINKNLIKVLSVNGNGINIYSINYDQSTGENEQTLNNTFVCVKCEGEGLPGPPPGSPRTPPLKSTTQLIK
jgi:hypothetical protein